MRLSMCSSSSSLSLRPSSALSSTQPILDEMEQVSRRNSFSSTSSGRSSNAAEQYETADSGWSSDGVRCTSRLAYYSIRVVVNESPSGSTMRNLDVLFRSVQRNS